MLTFAIAFETLKHTAGAIAQLVEQRTENPCVPGSIPGGTTEREVNASLFCFYAPLRWAHPYHKTPPLQSEIVAGVLVVRKC